jgi:hypothetical protein
MEHHVVTLVEGGMFSDFASYQQCDVQADQAADDDGDEPKASGESPPANSGASSVHLSRRGDWHNDGLRWVRLVVKELVGIGILLLGECLEDNDSLKVGEDHGGPSGAVQRHYETWSPEKQCLLCAQPTAMDRRIEGIDCWRSSFDQHHRHTEHCQAEEALDNEHGETPINGPKKLIQKCGTPRSRRLQSWADTKADFIGHHIVNVREVDEYLHELDMSGAEHPGQQQPEKQQQHADAENRSADPDPEKGSDRAQ